ncbi:MAG: 30S ribosomal protein S8 [Gammaproteobacteria bacterium RIFCSPHIGHO2_12_FULL_45_12]|nr:MAG: 30S ribosomal protein S8 [Gammaproteobacteria bacterium RIFCSPHIGHO2_12_FULL_45_12]
MSMQDPVSDMLTCIRNAQMMGIKQVKVPFSGLKCEMLRVLRDEGFIEEFTIVPDGNKKNISVTLKYYQGAPVIEKIKRVSKPSLRVYRGHDELPVVQGGLGVVIVSTPKGVMSCKVARAQKVGGEILCTVQ